MCQIVGITFVLFTLVLSESEASADIAPLKISKHQLSVAEQKKTPPAKSHRPPPRKKSGSLQHAIGETRKNGAEQIKQTPATSAQTQQKPVSYREIPLTQLVHRQSDRTVNWTRDNYRKYSSMLVRDSKTAWHRLTGQMEHATDAVAKTMRGLGKRLEANR